MERPVDATWLKRRVIELSTHPLNGWDSLGVMALIESAPTLRNPEYATAEWIKTKNNSGYKCSACGAREKISAVVNERKLRAVLDRSIFLTKCLTLFRNRYKIQL